MPAEEPIAVRIGRRRPAERAATGQVQKHRGGEQRQQATPAPLGAACRAVTTTESPHQPGNDVLHGTSSDKSHHSTHATHAHSAHAHATHTAHHSTHATT